MSTLLGPEEAELKILETTFSEAWDDVAFPYVIGDDAFQGERTKPWVRFSVLPGKGLREDLGSSAPRYEYPGTLTVQCFIPQQWETAPQWVAADLCQRVRAIFEDQQFVTDTDGHIVCYETSYQRLPPESSWQRYNVVTPYVRYEVTS